ncbi:MAG: DASS family sodium-coupled anion symporter [Acidimicrobiia bacterium]|nr:DASS family sodium-coupled anion symporter [Acidimicrobiia bacterium]
MSTVAPPSVPTATDTAPRFTRLMGLGVALAVLVGIVTLLLPTPDGLTPPAKNLAGVFVMAIILWVTEPVPIAVSSLLAIVLLVVFGVTTPGAAIVATMTPVFFFVLAMFCIAQVVVDSGLARRFALALLTRAGSDSRRVVLAFMIGAAMMSTVVSDVPVAAVWMSMALPLLARVAPVPGGSQFAKALMIGIPFASFIGGVGTPAGSSINILGLFQIQQFGKVDVSFLQWMAIGVPMIIVLTPVAWWVLVWWFRPEVASVGDPAELRAEQQALGAWSGKEMKVAGLLALMIVLWIASSWFRFIDTTIVALAGAVLMFVPGMNLLTWQHAQRSIGWDVLLLVGGVTSLGAAAGATGLAKYLVASLPDMTMWSVAAVIALISVVTVFIHLPLPVNPAIVGVLIPPIALLAISSGQNPALYTLPVVFMTSCALLLPLDSVTVITYAKGYYRMTDMVVPGLIISVVWVLVMTAMMVWVAPLTGLI